MRVTDWDPPHVLAIRHGGPVAGAGTWTLEPIEGGTRFVWVEDVRLDAPVVGALAARLYAPVMRLLMSRAMEGLRRYLIAAGPDGTEPSRRV